MKDGKLIKNIEDISCKSKVLFCLPFAGGGSSAFRMWVEKFQGKKMVVCPVQLPGREEKIMEEPYCDMEELLDDLFEQIKPYNGNELFLFGHSMGAKLSYELAKRLEENDIRVAGLIVSGSRVPHIPEPHPICHLPSKEFEKEISRFDGTPKEILENKEILEFFLPMLRADFIMDETYYTKEVKKLECPIVAFGGREDNEAEEEAIMQWEEYTKNVFRYEMFSGGHFFVREQEEKILGRLQEIMEVS